MQERQQPVQEMSQKEHQNPPLDPESTHSMKESSSRDYFPGTGDASGYYGFLRRFILLPYMLLGVIIFFIFLSVVLFIIYQRRKSYRKRKLRLLYCGEADQARSVPSNENDLCALNWSASQLQQVEALGPTDTKLETASKSTQVYSALSPLTCHSCQHRQKDNSDISFSSSVPHYNSLPPYKNHAIVGSHCRPHDLNSASTREQLKGDTARDFSLALPLNMPHSHTVSGGALHRGHPHHHHHGHIKPKTISQDAFKPPSVEFQLERQVENC